MHIYNWCHSTLQAFIIYTNTDYNLHGAVPLLFVSPCWFPFAPLSNPLYLLGTLLAVTGSVHLCLRLLVNWPPLSQPFPQSLPPPNSQNPGYQAPHYGDLKNPASSVRNRNKYCFLKNIDPWISNTYCISLSDWIIDNWNGFFLPKTTYGVL